MSNVSHTLTTRSTLALAISAAIGLGASAANAAQLEEVVVTAQKRSESSQDVGIAITALGEDEIVNADVNNIQDLMSMAPSLQIGESFGYAQVMIRGIGTDNPFAGSDPSVAMHFDGVVTSQASAQFGSLFDVDRIEVLRGPQGTLYGRNTTGGSVNVITKKPTAETEGYIRGTVGNYNLMKLEAAAGGALGDNLQARIATRVIDRGGYGKNLYTDNAYGITEIDDAKQQSARLQLLWGADSDLRVLFKAEMHKEDDTNYVPKFRAGSYSQELLDSVDPAVAAALVPQKQGFPRAENSRDIYSDVNLQNYKDQDSFTLDISYDLADGYTFNSVTNKQSFYRLPQQDFDMTQDDFYIQSEMLDTEQFSQEFRLNFETESMRGLVGAYYFKEDMASDTRLDLRLLPDSVANNVPGLSGCGFGDNNSGDMLSAARETNCIQFQGTAFAKANAVFANVDIDLSEQLQLTLGARYSQEDRGGDTTYWTAPGAPVLTYQDEKSFSKFTPTVRLEYSMNDDVMFYGSYSQGFKSGIFLSGQRSATLDPEIIDSYEFGMKGMFLDRTVQFNTAAFFYDYTDLQQGRSEPLGASGFQLVYENAASAEIKGIEADVKWLVNDQFTIDANATLMDPVFNDYISADPFDVVQQLPAFGIIAPDVDIKQQLAGNQLVQSPKVSYAIKGNYSFNMENGWNGMATAGLNYKGKVYFSPFNLDALSQDAVTTVNANIAFYSPDDKWHVNVWGKNLTDELIYQGTFILNSSRTNAGFMAPPRTVGVTVGYNF